MWWVVLLAPDGDTPLLVTSETPTWLDLVQLFVSAYRFCDHEPESYRFCDHEPESKEHELQLQ